jgi:hypothetical protein
MRVIMYVDLSYLAQLHAIFPILSFKYWYCTQKSDRQAYLNEFNYEKVGAD